MHRYKLSNFIDQSAAMIDVAISTTGSWLIKLWNEAVPPKISMEIEAKNKLVTYLDRVKTITEDANNKKNTLTEIKNRIEVEQARKTEEARKAEEARQALFAAAGIRDAPIYTPEKANAATAALMSAGTLVLNRAAGMVQLSTVANGVMTTASELAGWVSSAMWRGAVTVAETATVSGVGATVGAFVVGFWPGKAGEGSDRVPDRDIKMFAAQAGLFAAGQAAVQPEMNVIDLPVRGFITTDDRGQQNVYLVKTGAGGVSANVPVYRAVRDEQTGLDRITLPATAGAPSRTVLINPVPAGPTAPSHTGNDAPVPVTPVHTGTEVRQADSIVTTTFPAGEIPPLQDFIYWQPDATGSGVEPIYVILSGIYGETNAKGKYSGRDYNTDKAGGPIQNLDWRTASIDRAGVDKVKLHTGRFADSDANKVMIERLEKIITGELQITDTDKRFYTHEIRELERYRNLGIKDGELPTNPGELWNNTHTATLEDYQLGNSEFLLYTQEALQAAEEQELRMLK
ncbi:S-type pyocin domain-containing protein [Serratia rubidaea]|uniref:S-type pyocin domain-containing protein n=2 Tax=Serratia rubidaea TaxID=61652 RepID=A0ABS0M7D1_SERRU|nr:S-type pyocin domain-containing protein [Serratia rubidaea]